MATDGVTAAPEHALDVSDLEKFASPSIMKRVNEADTDKDGVLSVQELIQLVQSEQKAHADRRLFRNFLIALVVAVLILVAALVGAVYGIVKLTDEVDDSNGLLVSANTGSVMATGKATELVALSQLYAKASNSTSDSTDPVSIAQQMEILVVPHGEVEGGFTVHRVASIRSYPSEQMAIIVSEDGTVIQIDSSGLRYLRDPLVDLLPELSLSYMTTNASSSGQRRKLSEVELLGGYGVRSQETNSDDYDGYLREKSECCKSYEERGFWGCYHVGDCVKFKRGDPFPSFHNFKICVGYCSDMYCHSC